MLNVYHIVIFLKINTKSCSLMLKEKLRNGTDVVPRKTQVLHEKKLTVFKNDTKIPSLPLTYTWFCSSVCFLSVFSSLISSIYFSIPAVAFLFRERRCSPLHRQDIIKPLNIKPVTLRWRAGQGVHTTPIQNSFWQDIGTLLIFKT